MDKKFIIIGALLLLIPVTILRYVLTEEKEVPDVDWTDPYEISSKEGNGLWVLKQSLGVMYDDIVVSAHSINDSLSENHIQVYVHNKLDFSDDAAIDILDRVNSGMIVYLIARNIDFGYLDDDGICCYYGGEGVINQLEIDSINYKVSLENGEENILLSRRRVDSILSGYNQISTIPYKSDYYENNDDFYEEAYLHNCYKVGAGIICFNNAPELLTNYNSMQDYFLPYINEIFGEKPGNTVEIINKYKGKEVKREGFLRKILTDRSLKWAYYSLLLLLAIYVYFSGKRKQRAIPIVPQKRNTILEFVDVVSALYYKHTNPNKLSKKMQENFHFFMYERYNLKHTDDSYYTQLQRRLTSEPELLEKARELFSSTEYNDEKIETLYRTLDKLYKHAR